MNSVLLSAGAACVILGVVGGGAKAFGVEVPLLKSIARQVGLVLVGLLFLTAAYVVRDHREADPAVKAYRQEVRAVFCADKSASTAADLAASARNPDGTYDRARTISAYRARLAASHEVWAQLWRRPVPHELRAEVAQVRQALDNFFAALDAFVDAMPTELPSRFTDEQFDAFEARHQVTRLAAAGRANGALYALILQPCE